MGHKPSERLFEGFQGRPVHKRVDRAIEADLPAELRRFGTGLRIWYRSDKRDPGDPEGEGAQGHWKLFVHEHSAGVGIYDVDGGGGFDKTIEPRWPDVAFWLGRLHQFEYDDGAEVYEESPTGLDLWCWQDSKTLMALPRNLSGVQRVILWKGGRLRVTWRGIVH